MKESEELTIHILLDTLVRQYAPPVHINLIPNRHIIPQHADILQPCPPANAAVPTDNRALDPRMVLDLAARQQHAPLYPHAITDDDIGPNGDIRTDAAVLADLGRRVDEDVAAKDIAFLGGGEFLGTLLREGGEVEARAREEILGLSDVHPETLEVEGMQLVRFDDGGEGFLLDGGGAELDALQHGRVEDVDARIDAVANELDGLLDEAVDAGGVVGLVHDDTVFAGFFDFGDDDGSLFAVRLVELCELLEGVVAGDVGVEDEEGGVIFAKGLLGQLEGTSCTKRFCLDGEHDIDVVFLFVLMNLSCRDRLTLVLEQTFFSAPSMTSGR